MENESTQIDTEKKSVFKLGLGNSLVHYTVLVLTAVAVRIDLLGRSYPMSFDDGVYAMSVKHVSRGAQPYSEVFSSQGPFFLPLISFPSKVFGFHPWSMRLVPFVAGIIAVLFTYQIARRFLNTNWSFIAAFLVAISGTILRSTVPITSDGILAAVVLGCVLLAYNFIDKPNLLNASLLGISIGFGCGIKSVFMLPVLIFVLIATWRTGLILRLIAGFVSVGVFLIPFFIYGFKDTFDQSISYHLGKGESLSLGANFSKISTTLSSFDLFLLFALLMSFAIFVWYVFTTLQSKNANFSLLLKRVSDSKKPYLFILIINLGTIALSFLQTPLFRNHLAAIIAPLAISSTWIISRMIVRDFWVNQSKQLRTIVLGTITIIFIGSSYFSLATIYSDSLIRGSSELKAAIKSLEVLKEDSVILTNDPGLAFGSSMDVPIGLEDTSRYRFLSDNEDLSISAQSLESLLETDDSICAYAVAPLSISDEKNLREIAPDDWNVIFDDGYSIWLKPDNKCFK